MVVQMSKLKHLEINEPIVYASSLVKDERIQIQYVVVLLTDISLFNLTITSLLQTSNYRI